MSPAGPSGHAEHLVIECPTTLVPDVFAGSKLQPVQVAAQFPLGRWAIDDLYKLVREVHQIVERDPRIDARGGQKLKEGTVLVIRGIVVSAAAPPTAAQPRCAGHVQQLIPSFEIGSARAMVQFSPLAVLQRSPPDEIELPGTGGNGGHKVSTV